MNAEQSKRKLHHREDCTAEEFIAFLDAQEANPTVALDRASLERRTAEWYSEWQEAALHPLESSDDFVRRPERVVRFSPEGGLITRSPIFFDKATGEFIEFNGKGVSLLNKLSLAGIEYAMIGIDAENWARTKLSGRVMKSKGEIVNRVNK